MSIEEFIKYPEFNKLDILLEFGRLHSRYEGHDHFFNVYNLYDFFVELKINKLEYEWPYMRPFKNAIDTSGLTTNPDGGGASEVSDSQPEK